MEDYLELEEIGKGSYGTVFKCKHRATGEIVAIKQMKDEDGNEQMRKTAIREAKLLKQLQHPNVVRLMELFRSKTRLYMVFEFMDRSILKLLESNPRGLPLLEVKKILWQLVLALNFLHGQQIIHRDLKPENILTTDAGTVKLADFGFARPQPHGGHNLSPYVATRWYRAPELLVGDTYGPGVDVWALGCLLVELATGQPLFPGKSNLDQLWLIVRCVGWTPRQMSRVRSNTMLSKMTLPTEEELIPLEKRYAYFDRASMALLKACLEPEPQKRPTAIQLMTHEYFTSPQAQKVLAPYTAAASQAVTDIKIGGGKAAAGRPAAEATEPLPEKTIKLSDHQQGHGHNHNHVQNSKPAATPSQPTLQRGMSARPQGPMLPGTQQPKLPGTALPRQHDMAQQHAAVKQQAGGGGGGGGGVKEGGSACGSDLDMPRGYTGSDDGAGADAPDDEYEAEPEEHMTAEARAKIQRWVDAIPEAKTPSNIKTVLSVMPGGAANYGGMSPGGMSPGGIQYGATADGGLFGGLASGAQSPLLPGWQQAVPLGILPTTVTMTATRPPTATGAAASILSSALNSNQGLSAPPPVGQGGHSPINGSTASVMLTGASGNAMAAVLNTPSILNHLIKTPGVLTSEPPTLSQLQQGKATPGQGIQGMLLPFPGDADGMPAVHVRATHGPTLPARLPPGQRNRTQEHETLEQMILRQLGIGASPTSSSQAASQPSHAPHAPAISADGTPSAASKTLERFASLRQSSTRNNFARSSLTGVSPNSVPEPPIKPITNHTSSPGGIYQSTSTPGGRAVLLSTDGKAMIAPSAPIHASYQPVPPTTPLQGTLHSPTSPLLPSTSSTGEKDRTSTASTRRLATLTIASTAPVSPVPPSKPGQMLSPSTLPSTPATTTSTGANLISPLACPSPVMPTSDTYLSSIANSPCATAAADTACGTPASNAALDTLIKASRATAPSPTSAPKDGRSALQILIEEQAQQNSKSLSNIASLSGSHAGTPLSGMLTPHPPSTPAPANDPMASFMRFVSNNGIVNDGLSPAKPFLMQIEEGAGSTQAEAPSYISLLESLASGSRTRLTSSRSRNGTHTNNSQAVSSESAAQPTPPDGRFMVGADVLPVAAISGP